MKNSAFVYLIIVYAFFTTKLLSQTVSGTVWVDINANGLKDESEPLLPDVTIRLFYDFNNDGLPERIIDQVQTDANGNYAFEPTSQGLFVVGVDPLSFPDTNYRFTTQYAASDTNRDSNLSPHTYRTDVFNTINSGALNLEQMDIGVLEGSDELIFLGKREITGQPVHSWLYQDIHFSIQDLGNDPMDSSYRATMLKWMKWYAVGERITQEADLNPRYLEVARHSDPLVTSGITVKNFYTIWGLGSYAAGQGTTSSGIPARKVLEKPDIIEDHILMFYETTRGMNPPWKYRTSWPHGGRLTHHVLTGIILFELGGLEAYTAKPNITPWNPGRDAIEALRLWELKGLSIAEAFPVQKELILNGGELINHYSIELEHPENSSIEYKADVRGIQTAIILEVFKDLGRAKAFEILYNMSRSSWYTPSQDQSLIAFKRAVNEATDGKYADKFTKWGFPEADVYDDNQSINTGNLEDRTEFKWDCKPHNYAPEKIRNGYSHLSDRSVQGFVKWNDLDASNYRNLGAIDFLANTSDITYPNKDAFLVVGEGVSLTHKIPNGEWVVKFTAVNDRDPKITFADGELVRAMPERSNGRDYIIKVNDGTFEIVFNGEVRLSEITITKYYDCPENGTLTMERWDNIPGETIDLIPTNTVPDRTETLDIFEISVNASDNYGARVRGIICTPQTGNYIFWIAGDNTAELRLSTDENPGNLALIANVPDWTNPNEWTKYPEQQSNEIYLEEGKSYYIEALMKEEDGGDNLSVGWELPDGTKNRPITLPTCFVNTGVDCNNTLGVNTSQIKKNDVKIYPNPANDIINIASKDLTNYKISLYTIMGKSIKTSVNNPKKLTVRNLSEGVYLLQIENLNSGLKTYKSFIIKR